MTGMRRYLVVFCPRARPRDATVVDVHAHHELEAIMKARREHEPEHVWSVATARPWPVGWIDADDAMMRLAP